MLPSKERNYNGVTESFTLFLKPGNLWNYLITITPQSVKVILYRFRVCSLNFGILLISVIRIVNKKSYCNLPLSKLLV